MNKEHMNKKNRRKIEEKLSLADGYNNIDIKTIENGYIIKAEGGGHFHPWADKNDHHLQHKLFIFSEIRDVVKWLSDNLAATLHEQKFIKELNKNDEKIEHRRSRSSPIAKVSSNLPTMTPSYDDSNTFNIPNSLKP